MTHQYRAVDGLTLIQTLGFHNCSPHPSYSAYLIGPDCNGRLCHLGSYRSMVDAKAAADRCNKPEPFSPIIHKVVGDPKPPVGGPGDDYDPNSPHYRRYNGD